MINQKEFGDVLLHCDHVRAVFVLPRLQQLSVLTDKWRNVKFDYYDELVRWLPSVSPEIPAQGNGKLRVVNFKVTDLIEHQDFDVEPKFKTVDPNEQGVYPLYTEIELGVSSVFVSGSAHETRKAIGI